VHVLLVTQTVGFSWLGQGENCLHGTTEAAGGQGTALR
jgi:hypothetical protein